MADWKTPKRGATCAAGDHPFEEGQRIFSVLSVGAEGIRRQDFCEPCFAARPVAAAAAGEAAAPVEDRQPAQSGPGQSGPGQSGPEPSRPGEDVGTEDSAAAEQGAEQDVIWWRTVHRTEERRGLALDFDAIERLFLALADRTEERPRELRYLMALLLLRKRRLKVVRVARSSEGERMIVRRPRRDEEHAVWVFDLTPERAEELRGELLALFEGAEAGEPPQLEDDEKDEETDENEKDGDGKDAQDPAPREDEAASEEDAAGGRRSEDAPGPRRADERAGSETRA